jgi:hypothetical protein
VTFRAHLDVVGGISGDMALGVKRQNTSPQAIAYDGHRRYGAAHKGLGREKVYKAHVLDNPEELYKKPG